MVNVTERAKEKLMELLATETDDPSVGLRLEATAAGEFGIFPDHEREDDQVIEHKGAVVLLIGQEVAQTTEGTTIDCEESEPRARLVIRRS